MIYTVREFKLKTREAFNEAEQGKTVYIIRHGIKFKLVKDTEDDKQ